MEPQNYLKINTIVSGCSYRDKKEPNSDSISFGEGRPEILIRLYTVVDWCLEHPEYTAKIKVIPKKDYPVLMPCTF